MEEVITNNALYICVLDLDAIEEMINNLKADMRERFVRQEDFKEFKQRVED